MKIQVTVRQPVAKPQPAPPQVRRSATRERARSHATDVHTLLAQAMASPPLPLPHRAELEAQFGQHLDQIPVYGSESAYAALQLLHAEAMTYQGAIFLADPYPSLDLIAHEVVHVLQMKPGACYHDTVVAATAPAEQEAATLAAQVKERSLIALKQPRLPVTTTLSPATVALRRTALPTPPTNALASSAFHRTVEREPTATAPVAMATMPTPAQRSPEPAQPLPTIEPEQPPFELPPPPVPGIRTAADTAQEAAPAQVEAALTTADDPAALMAAFTAAPPTRKAQHAATLGEEIAHLAQANQATFANNVPELHATLRSQAETPPPLTLKLPAARAPNLAIDAPLPRLTMSPSPAIERYTANDGITTDLTRLMSGAGDERAANIAERLHNVNTSDHDLATSPGARPAIPLTAGTDPANIDQQMTTGVTQARQIHADATQVVLNGPGPEQVQPLALDETYLVGELAQPEISVPAMPAAPQAYLALNLPPVVQTTFDQQHHTAMTASLNEVQTQVAEASAERDRQRTAAVTSAQTQAQEQSAQADEQQRATVWEARQQIQSARQETLNEQQAAVANIEEEATAEHTATRRNIDERVHVDEARIEQEYATAERAAQAEVASGERRATAERTRAEREAAEQSWWDRAINFVRAAFAALTKAISDIFAAVRRAVNAILDRVKAVAMRLIDAATAFINRVITAFGALLQRMVNTLIGSVFPALAARLSAAIATAVASAQRLVNAAADGLKAGIVALVEGLRTSLNAIISTYQAAVTTALNLAQAAIAGDWAALAQMALEAVLRVVGIEPETFYQFIGRAQETFQLILDNPAGFVDHLLAAFLTGVRRFASNFLTHLQAGIIGWLTGALGGVGIQLPERFDLKGVLSLIQQILALTWDRLRERAVRLIGERAVSVLEFVAGYLHTLIEGGWDALWQRIQDDLASLRDMVLQSIKDFLLERIVMAAITRLTTMFNPVGAIINLILTAYNLFTFLRDQLARISAVVQTVTNAIGDIARGVIQPAAQRVEEVLARLLPLAIDLLARLLGLGNVGSKVRTIIERVRGVVDRAIDRLIERVRGMFRGGAAGSGGRAATGDQSPSALAREPAAQTATSVKTQALRTFQQRVHHRHFQSFDALQTILTGIYRELQPHGLRSIAVRIVNPTTMAAEVQATASPSERLSISWAELFGTQDDAVQVFAIQPRYETNATLSINGRRFGAVVASDNRGHAEQNLLATYWKSALQETRALVARGTPTTVAVAINRSPCHNICTPALVAAMNGVEPELKHQVRFILAPTGVYEPTARLTDEEIQREHAELRRVAQLHGRSVRTLIRDQLSKVRYTKDTTTFSDLRRLVAAGWDVAQLQARSAPTQAGTILAEASHKVMREAQRLRAGS